MQPDPKKETGHFPAFISWLLFCLVFSGIPLIILFFLFNGIFAEKREALRKKVESRLDRELNRLQAWENPEFFFNALLDECWQKLRREGIKKNVVAKINSKLQKRFPGVLEFLFLDSKGDAIPEVTPQGAPKAVLKRFFSGLVEAKNDNLIPLEKDWPIFSSFIGPMRNPYNIGFDRIRPAFLSDRHAFAYFISPGPDGLFIAFLNRVEGWDLLGLNDRIRRFNSFHKTADAKLINLARFKNGEIKRPGRDSSRADQVDAWIFNGPKDILWQPDQVLAQRLIGSDHRLVIQMKIPPLVSSEDETARLVLLEIISFIIFSLAAALIQYCNFPLFSSVKTRIFFLFLFTVLIPVSVVLLSTKNFLIEFRKVRESDIGNEMENVLNLFDRRMPRILGETQASIERDLNKPLAATEEFSETSIRRMEELIRVLSPNSAWIIDTKGNLVAESRMKVTADTGMVQKFAKGTYIEIFNKLNDTISPENNNLQSSLGEFTKAFGVDTQEFLNGILSSVGKLKEMKFGKKKGFQGVFPIRAKSGKTIFLGVFIFERENLALKYVTKHFPRLGRQKENAKFFAWGSDRMERKFPPDSGLWSKFILLRDKIAGGKRVVKTHLAGHGGSSLVTGILGEESGYFLFSLVKDLEIRREEENILWFLKLYIFGILLIISTVTSFLSRKFLQPLNNLSTGLDAIKERDFRHRIPPGENDEFGNLIETFNNLMESLADLEVAKIVQESLFPAEALKKAGLEIFGLCKPATQVGGDYFDYFPLSENHTAIIIGDVSGHGVSAAIVMSMAKALISHPANDPDPAKILGLLNLVIWQCLKRKKIMTCWMGIVDLKKGKLLAANAGHNEAFLIREGKTRLLEFAGPVVGVGPRGKYTNNEVPILPGDVLVQVTDGIIEAITNDGNVVGYERITATLPDLIRETAEKTENAIREWHTGIVKPGLQADDITILVVQVSGVNSGSNEIAGKKEQ